jgi:hypothetical protein
LTPCYACDMSHYPNYDTTSLCSYSLLLRACGEASNTNVILFGLTRPRLEPTIYHTRGEHANHYNTVAGSTRLTGMIIVIMFKLLQLASVGLNV